jgi:EmrB/QacA subfamily drug resistance transporter
VLAGGVLTKYLGWEWIFFVNVPVGAAVLALTLRVVRESRRETERRRYDPLGAVSVTAGLVLFVYAMSKAPEVGWLTARTILLLLASLALLGAFLVIERTVEQPLMPIRIFRVRTVAGANAVAALLGVVIFANFFVLTLYVQNVLHYSALKTGFTFVATAGTAVLSAGVAQALVTRLGPKPVMAVGLALMTGGMLWYSQVPVDGSYASDLLPGYLMVGVGIAFSFIPVQIAALAGVAERDAGLASGLINTSQQIGGGLGVAIASTVFTSRFDSLVHDGKSIPAALTGGYQGAFWALAGFGVLALVAALVLIRREEMAEVPATAPLG